LRRTVPWGALSRVPLLLLLLLLLLAAGGVA
jgi:hypothetical protein